jgi:vacuolar-type H+-ATPase subunit E/Vma4
MMPHRKASREQEAALAPVRAAMLRRASAEAAHVLASARGAAGGLRDSARAEAARTVSRAREDGQAQAAPLALAEVSRGRREAQAILLDAELRARDELESRIRSAILGLRSEPGYGTVRETLSELARRTAGPGATVSEHQSGGVVAHAPGVLVDCSLPRLAERAIEVLGPRIRELSAL